MAMTITQVATIKCGTDAEYNASLVKLQATATQLPTVYQSVVGTLSKREIVITTKANPFIFDTAN